MTYHCAEHHSEDFQELFGFPFWKRRGQECQKAGGGQSLRGVVGL